MDFDSTSRGLTVGKKRLNDHGEKIKILHQNVGWTFAHFNLIASSCLGNRIVAIIGTTITTLQLLFTSVPWYYYGMTGHKITFVKFMKNFWKKLDCCHKQFISHNFCFTTHGYTLIHFCTAIVLQAHLVLHCTKRIFCKKIWWRSLLHKFDWMSHLHFRLAEMFSYSRSTPRLFSF